MAANLEGEELERLARMADEKAEAFEVDAEEWGEVDPFLDTRAQEYARQDAAKAADWRKIAEIIRSSSSSGVRIEGTACRHPGDEDDRGGGEVGEERGGEG